MRELKKKFLLFSIFGLIFVLAVSTFTIVEHKKILKKQQQISVLYKSINVSLSNIHKISDLVGSLRLLNQKNVLNNIQKSELSGYIIKAKENEKLLIQWISNNEQDPDMLGIIDIFKEKEFKQRVDRFLDKAEELIDFSDNTQTERIDSIKVISKMSQNSLDVLFSKVIDKVSLVQKRFIRKTERIGLFLVSICLIEILFVWFFIFKPFYNMVNQQHEELKSLKYNLEKANTFKDDFITNISHEIRTPMTAILGYIDLLKKNEMPFENKFDAYEVISRNADHLLDLIDEVLDVSAMETGKLVINTEVINLNSILNEVFSLMRAKAELKNIEFNITYETSVYKKIKTDPKRFKQILINLIGNSIKFTDKGSVDLKLSINKFNDLDIRVVDTGCGIEKEKRSFLFKPFSQADNSVKRKYGGTGLGLVISERLADKLWAKLIIEKTEFGKGTTMLLTFSKKCFLDKKNTVNIFSYDSLEVYENTSLKNSRSDLKGVKVLIVDDSRENVFLFRAFLKKANANVDVAYGGEEALKKIEDKTYDLVLLDLQMPDMSGYEVLDVAKKIVPTLKFFALTAHAMKSEEEKTKKAGFDAHISKPIAGDELVEVIYKLLK